MKYLLLCLLPGSVAVAQSAATPEPPRPLVAPQAPRRFVAAQNSFGLALLRQISQAAPRTNVFLSPLSVANALLLVLDGTAGSSHQAVAKALHLGTLPADTLRAGVAAQWAGLVNQGQPTLLLANSLWTDKSFPLSAAYAAHLREQYHAQATSLDFAAPGAVAAINAWVSQQTQGKIPALVTPQSFQPPLLLANAAYFSGTWTWKFNPAATRPGRFHPVTGQPRMVPLMHQRSTHFGYLAGPGWQAVRLPYEGFAPAISMQLVVPTRRNGLADFLAGLTAAQWATWQAAFQQAAPPTEVELTLPCFRLEWAGQLLPALQQLGLPAAADFSPIGFDATQPGRIGSVIHKTYLAVNEQGTEAAAATVVEMIIGYGGRRTRPRHVAVRADRPFFCAIVDDRTGTILFSGVVYQPD